MHLQDMLLEDLNDTSTVIKTTDGGANWIDKSVGFLKRMALVIAVEFIDANTGLLVVVMVYFLKQQMVEIPGVRSSIPFNWKERE